MDNWKIVNWTLYKVSPNSEKFTLHVARPEKYSIKVCMTRKVLVRFLLVTCVINRLKNKWFKLLAFSPK